MAGESFVWLFTVPAFGEEGVPGITIAQGQPEAVHEIIIGAKRRKFFRTGTSNKDVPYPCREARLSRCLIKKQDEKNKGAQGLRLVFCRTSPGRIKGQDIF